MIEDIAPPADMMTTQPDDAAAALNRWLTLAALSLVTGLLVGGVVVSLGIYVPVLERAEGWSATAMGTALTGMLLGMSVSGIVAGAVTARIGAKPTILVGTFLAAAACWLASQAHSEAMFLIAVTILGLGIGAGSMVPSIAVITQRFHKERGLGLGIFFAAMALAAAFLPLAVASWIDAYSWRSALQVTGTAIATSSLTVLPLNLRQSIRDTDADAPKSTIGSAILNARFWMITVAMTLSLVGSQGVLYAAVPYFTEGGVSIVAATRIYSIANFVSVPGMFMVGALADRLGAKRVLPLGLVAQAIGTAGLLIAAPHDTGGLIGIALFALFWGGSAGVAPQLGPMLIHDVAGRKNFGTLLGVNAATTGLVGSSAPLLTAVVKADFGGGYAPVFTLYAAMAVVAMALIRLACRGVQAK